jgi:hypothetical protein
MLPNFYEGEIDLRVSMAADKSSTQQTYRHSEPVSDVRMARVLGGWGKRGGGYCPDISCFPVTLQPIFSNFANRALSRVTHDITLRYILACVLIRNFNNVKQMSPDCLLYNKMLHDFGSEEIILELLPYVISWIEIANKPFVPAPADSSFEQLMEDAKASTVFFNFLFQIYSIFR